jgi:hypothetical protein
VCTSWVARSCRCSWDNFIYIIIELSCQSNLRAKDITCVGARDFDRRSFAEGEKPVMIVFGATGATAAHSVA